MSMMIERSPRFSSGAALMRHYAALKHRMSNLAPPPLLALPSPEIMARGNDMQPIAIVPTPKPVEKPRILITGDLATVVDIVPEQYGRAGPEIEPLSEEIERVAVRRAILAYLSKLRGDRTTNRSVMVRNSAASAFKMDLKAILGASRTNGVVRPRQFGMCLAKRLTGASLPEIGRAFGGKDHTTVLYAVRKMAGFVEEILGEMFDGQSCELAPYIQPEPQVLDGQ